MKQIKKIISCILSPVVYVFLLIAYFLPNKDDERVRRMYPEEFGGEE